MKRDEISSPVPTNSDLQRQLWIDTLGHARHDWLNDLQLIIGYVKLNKTDKLASFVEMLKQKMNEESRIARWGHPKLVEFLLTYRARSLPFAFHLHTGSELSLVVAVEKRIWLEEAMFTLLEVFQQDLSLGAKESDRQLHCIFQQEDQAITIFLKYYGTFPVPELERVVASMNVKASHWHGLVHIDFTHEASSGQIRLRTPLKE
jgi:stage 0 sporulation protein B (sporulation initiation phosphotransferase)